MKNSAMGKSITLVALFATIAFTGCQDNSDNIGGDSGAGKTSAIDIRDGAKFNLDDHPLQILEVAKSSEYRQKMKADGAEREYYNFISMSEYQNDMKDKGCEVTVKKVSGNYADATISCGKAFVGGDTPLEKINNEWHLPLAASK
ncbi:MAG: hypothetical protein PHV10_06115 [Sulfuricurvum sp.]|nr:hypothetical protein [Sulfuricurvum sp.]